MNRKAFTLIELLVVVTIIVILIALLLPAMEKAMKAATTARCAATLHPWAIAMRQYAIDNKGSVILLLTATGGDNWWGRVAKYMGQPDYDKPGATNVGALAANVCPSAGPYAGGNGGGSATTQNIESELVNELNVVGRVVWLGRTI